MDWNASNTTTLRKAVLGPSLYNQCIADGGRISRETLQNRLTKLQSNGYFQNCDVETLVNLCSLSENSRLTRENDCIKGLYKKHKYIDRKYNQEEHVLRSFHSATEHIPSMDIKNVSKLVGQYGKDSFYDAWNNMEETFERLREGGAGGSYFRFADELIENEYTYHLRDTVWRIRDSCAVGDLVIAAQMMHDTNNKDIQKLLASLLTNAFDEYSVNNLVNRMDDIDEEHLNLFISLLFFYITTPSIAQEYSEMLETVITGFQIILRDSFA